MAARNTKMSRSRWSYGKIEDCEQSIIVSNGAFMWREWTLSYGSPKGTSVLTLNQSLFFSKIGVCIFENRSLFFFWKSEFVFWKPEFVLKKIGVIFWKSEFVLFKIGVCFLKVRVLAPDSVLSFCSWVRTKSVALPGEGPGGPAPLYFLTKLRPKKTFWRRSPSLSQGLDDRLPLPLIWRSFKK